MVLVLGSACAPRITAHRGAFGAPIRAAVDGAPEALTGELLAVGEDTVWVRVGESLQHAMLSRMSVARIERGRRGMRHGLLRGVVFGVVTGALMSAACSTVDDAGGCGGVFVRSTVIAMLAGFLAGVDNESDRFLRIERPTAPVLVPWARYPQGLPILIREARRVPDPSGTPSRPQPAAGARETAPEGASQVRRPLRAHTTYGFGARGIGTMRCAYGVPFHITNGPPLSGSVDRPSSSRRSGTSTIRWGAPSWIH